jgi:hypothetical protein
MSDENKIKAAELTEEETEKVTGGCTFEDTNHRIDGDDDLSGQDGPDRMDSKPSHVTII